MATDTGYLRNVLHTPCCARIMGCRNSIELTELFHTGSLSIVYVATETNCVNGSLSRRAHTFDGDGTSSSFGHDILRWHGSL